MPSALGLVMVDFRNRTSIALERDEYVTFTIYTVAIVKHVTVNVNYSSQFIAPPHWTIIV